MFFHHNMHLLTSLLKTTPVSRRDLLKQTNERTGHFETRFRSRQLSPPPPPPSHFFFALKISSFEIEKNVSSFEL
jgi:hypothetical protein